MNLFDVIPYSLATLFVIIALVRDWRRRLQVRRAPASGGRCR